LTRNAISTIEDYTVIYWLAGIETGERIEGERSFLFGGVIIYIYIYDDYDIVVDSSSR
jgi:hypothetical protein